MPYMPYYLVVFILGQKKLKKFSPQHNTDELKY